MTNHNLKPMDLKLLGEMLKNSHRSDRDLAKSLKLSQPTITRKRTNLEKNYIDGYTVIPRWEKIGYEIVAFTLVKHNIKYAKENVREESMTKVKEWMKRQPNIVMAIEGQGMGWDGMFVSFHKNYSDYAEFMKKHNTEFAGQLIDCQSFISSVNPTAMVKPFHLKYLAETL